MMAPISAEEQNFVRLMLLLNGVTPRAVRTLFDKIFPHTNLNATLQANRHILESRKNLNQAQLDLLFPKPNGVPYSMTFDVTLMVYLIRNFSNINRPTNGFDSLPLPTDTSPESDLARIKWYRNKLSHHDSDKIDSVFFTEAWDDLSYAVGRLGGQQMKEECQELKSKILDLSNQELMREIRQSQLEIDNLESRQEEITETIGKLRDSHDTLKQRTNDNQEPSRQPRSTIEWLSYAEQLRENAMTRLQSGMVKRGRQGHDVALVLDCSERMTGAKFDTMIETAKIYVNGIKQIKRVRMLEDNIGLAVFGGTSRVIVQTTSDYDLVLKEIGQLKPEGKAPLVGGLLMGLACALGGGTSEILGNEVPGYMVVFTDGMSANIKPELDQDIDPSFLIGDFKKQDKISSIIKKIAGFAVKIFYVPMGDNEQNEVMQSAVSETNGKVICRQEIHRLVRMTQVLMLAAEVASDLRKNNSNPTAAEVREKIVQQTSRPDDAHNDCVDLVLEFVKPRIKERKKGLYSELVCRTLLLGDRVRRGPDWSFHEQDSGLAGTVVGQDSDSEAVWVEWDNGHLNMYIYDERLDKYSIKKVQEPRVLADELVAVGCKVTRGKDWTYADADGGLGSVGTVLCVNQDGSVLVRWDSRNIEEYKMGMNGLFEIQICNDSSTSQPTYKDDVDTNKYQSAQSSTVDFTTGQEWNKTRSSAHQNVYNMTHVKVKESLQGSQIKQKEEDSTSVKIFATVPRVSLGGKIEKPNKLPHKMTEKHTHLQEVSAFEKTEYVKKGFLDCIIDKRIHTVNYSTTENLKRAQNLLIKCNAYLVNCDVDRRLDARTNFSDVLLKYSSNSEEMQKFVKLVFTSYHIDRKTLPSAFWKNIFVPVIEMKDSKLCLFLLTIMADMEADEWKKCNHHLFKGLSTSMINQDKDTSKVIAWFITKKCFLSLDKSIRENITDIWPVFICNCHKQKQEICSSKHEHMEITIEINTLSQDLPATFWKIDIKYFENTRSNNDEGKQIHERLQSFSGNFDIQATKSISSTDAKQLFDAHSNLSLICKSPFKSTGFRKHKQKVIAQPCIQLYCKRKGFIPIGENHFSEILFGLKTDVLEGTPHFLSNLKVGNQVGTDEFKRGTLGGFVQVRGDIAFLTCLHVFLSADELASDNLSLDDKTKVSVKLYQKNQNSHICGKVREIAFAVDNDKETSIDAALIEIAAESIDKTDYVDIENTKLSFQDLGMKSEYINNSCVDYKRLLYTSPKPVLRTVCVGAVSGGSDPGSWVSENDKKDIDLVPIDQIYSSVILDEIKEKVKIVIDTLQLIPIAVLPDYNAIKLYIETKCNLNIPPAIKTLVSCLISKIYPATQLPSDEDIENLIKCEINRNLSVIIADVNMQQAFLKKTAEIMAIKRTSRRVYNQLYISNIPFKPGDSGMCIYVVSPVEGCIGMAIADHPQGGCIATPIMDILRYFKIRIKRKKSNSC